MNDYAAHYPFPGPFKPMENQRRRFNFLLSNRTALDLSDMGTGKTYTALWAADCLMRVGGGSVLVFAPLTTLESVWRKSCNDILGVDGDGHPRFLVLSGSGSLRARTVEDNGDLLYVTNYESLLNESFRKAVLKSDVHTIIVDEVTKFKHANTSLSKFFREVSFNKSVWGLTATPMPNSPLNAFGIAKAVHSHYRESLNSFRNRTHIKKDMWVWVPKDNANDTAHNILQPSIRVTRDECGELPPSSVERRNVSLSRAAHDLYKQLRREAFAALDGGRVINVAHEASLRNKLLQVCGGAVYTEDRSVEAVDAGERAEELVSLLQQTDEKIIVFVPYRHQLKLVERLIRDEGYSVVSIHGDVNQKERGRIIQAFQKIKFPRVIVADPRTMAHGVELTAASIVCWWLPCDSNELYVQANGRVDRKGQIRHTRVIQLCASPLEASIYDRLEARQSLQGALLEALKDGEDQNRVKKKSRRYTGGLHDERANQ